MSDPGPKVATYADLLRLPDDVRAEILLYASHGVPHDWIVDVDVRTLEAFQLREGRWLLLGNYDDSAVARIAPVEAVELAIARLFVPAIDG